MKLGDNVQVYGRKMIVTCESNKSSKLKEILKVHNNQLSKTLLILRDEQWWKLLNDLMGNHETSKTWCNSFRTFDQWSIVATLLQKLRSSNGRTVSLIATSGRFCWCEMLQVCNLFEMECSVCNKREFTILDLQVGALMAGNIWFKCAIISGH